MTHQLNPEKARDKITNIINMLMNQHSGSILITTNKDTIYQNYFGYSDRYTKKTITNATQFLAGSVTKQFTAVAILKAILDKNTKNIQAELNHSIDHYLPAKHEIWNNVMPAWAKIITLHQLLVHSSGIVNYTSLPDFENQIFLKSSDLIYFFKNHELEFTPGEKFSYSNSGYYLLGLIIQEITNQPLDVYLEKSFFKPLNMHSTHFPTHGTVNDLIQRDARFSNLARGYQYEITEQDAALEEIKRYEPMDVPGAAGSLISTTEDLLKWNNALYAGKILPPFLLQLMLKPYLVTEREEAYYGYGIEIMKSETLGEYYSHRGGIPGFRSILTFIPSLQLTISTMQNITADQAKIMPEIKAIKASLPEITKIIEGKYPHIIENRKCFELAPIYDEIIKALEAFF